MPASLSCARDAPPQRAAPPAAQEVLLDVSGETRRFAPLPEDARAALAPSAVEAAAERHALNASWRRLARTPTLEVVVLGASVSAGCGGAAPAVDCAPGSSWVRHFAVWLGRLLPPATQARVHVHAKNAVMLDWFSHCTAAYVAPNTSLVLIEFQGSMVSSDVERMRADLSALAESVRRAAPSCVIGFIGWPRKNSRADPLEAPHDRLISSVASRCAFDVLFASRLFGKQLKAKARELTLYADSVHPNPKGHTLLGEAAARFVAAHVCRAASGELEEAPSHGGPAAAVPVGQQPPLEEWCFLTPWKLPLASRGDDWVVVNEGGAKGVLKEGFLSRRVGSSLVLGPLLEGRCIWATAHLGYLQSWRSDQGAFSIRCIGCACHSAISFSFPIIQTSSRRPTSTIGAGQNCKRFRWGLSCGRDLADATVTVPTRFHITKHEGRSCFINITHVNYPVNDVLNSSRVRIDSLTLVSRVEYKTCLSRSWTRDRRNAHGVVDIAADRQSDHRFMLA